MSIEPIDLVAASRDYSPREDDLSSAFKAALAEFPPHWISIVAGAFAAAHPARVVGLRLLSPASGYGAADPEVRAQKRYARPAMLAELGPVGLAAKHSAYMLSGHASDAARESVRWNMVRVIPHGYAQGAHLLASADLASDLTRGAGSDARQRYSAAIGVEDAITPPDACARIVVAARVPSQIAPGAGHVDYAGDAPAYSAQVAEFSATCDAYVADNTHGDTFRPSHIGRSLR